MMLVAIVAGIAAVILAARWIQQQTQPGSGKVAVALLDIQLGSRIAPEMVHLVDWPAASVPNGAFTKLDDLSGRVARTSLQRGEPVLEGKLAPVGTKGGLSAVVAEGRRAITVKVNEVYGVAGFALPGNYVDIMVNTQEEGAKGSDKDRTISKIVLEHILVLAVAQEAGRDETKPKVVNAVTLEVTPEQAEKLDLARSVGTLSLVLRNQIDPEPSGTTGATKDSLLGKAAKPAAPHKIEKAPVRVAKPATVVADAGLRDRMCVEVIRGKSKTNECF
jgi:pilus assembly protein CpaB